MIYVKSDYDFVVTPALDDPQPYNLVPTSTFAIPFSLEPKEGYVPVTLKGIVTLVDEDTRKYAIYAEGDYTDDLEMLVEQSLGGVLGVNISMMVDSIFDEIIFDPEVELPLSKRSYKTVKNFSGGLTINGGVSIVCNTIIYPTPQQKLDFDLTAVTWINPNERNPSAHVVKLS